MNTEKTAIDMHNLISSDEAFNIIETSVKALIENPELAHALPPVMLRGAPGVGKSSIVKAVAKKLGIDFIDFRLAQREPVDLRGLPVPNHEDKSVQWYVTSDLPRDPNSKGILMFDELTAADKSLQVASYELILDRRLGNLYKLPDGWFIVAAGNRTKDKAVATAMSSALANRLSHFEVEANSEDWLRWAIQHSIQPSVTGFIKYRPACLFKMDGQNLECGWPSPRSWERVSNILPLYKDNEEVLRKVVYSLIGNNVGVEFMEFHRINKKFDDVLEIMLDPDAEINIPDRADERYAMCSAVAYLLWNGKDEADEAARIEGMYRIVMKLPADFATLLVKNAMLGNKKITRVQACMKIIKSPSYKNFAEKYGQDFTKQYKLK